MNNYAILTLSILHVETFLYKDDFLKALERYKNRGTPVLVLTYDQEKHEWEPGVQL